MSAAPPKLCEHRVSAGAYCPRCAPPSGATKVYEAHPAADLFPMMGDAELRDLADDIREHGLLDPILLFEGKVLDGRNRLRACEMAEVEPRFKQWSGDEPTAFVISANLHRRQLTKGQLAAIGAEAMPLLRAEGLARLSAAGRSSAPGRPAEKGVHQGAEVSGTSITNEGRSRQIASEKLGGAVSGMSIQRAASVKEVAPDVFAEIKSGKITIDAGLRRAGLNKNGTRGPQKVSPQRRHGAVIEAAAAFVKVADGWDPEMAIALTPPEARKQVTVLKKASEHLARLTEAVEYRAATPHQFLGR